MARYVYDQAWEQERERLLGMARLWDAGAERYLQVLEKTALRHEEHAPVPLAPGWLLGVMPWRTLAVPVVSFEALMGATVTGPTPSSKVVILYPLPGRRDWEFFAILTHAEPRPQTIDPAHAVAATSAELPDTPYIAAGLKLGGRLLVIPDLEALKKAFYP